MGSVNKVVIALLAGGVLVIGGGLGLRACGGFVQEGTRVHGVVSGVFEREPDAALTNLGFLSTNGRKILRIRYTPTRTTEAAAVRAQIDRIGSAIIQGLGASDDPWSLVVSAESAQEASVGPVTVKNAETYGHGAFGAPLSASEVLEVIDDRD